ncbi:MAG: FCD domain-containing protein [Deltaproteobacteria bacterium]|nr:FCD domain-containing protein [Deltaproteobacteria bacterium]
MREGSGALVQMRAFIAQREFNPHDQLPPERKLCEMLGVSRAQLRKAFAVLEAEGAIWRHVGRGTFIGDGADKGMEHSLNVIAKQSTPLSVMRARIVLEPQLAREAALHATAENMENLRRISSKSRQAATWREYETLDNELHREIAEASQCTPLVALFDQLNALRRTVVWGRLRTRPENPPSDHHSFSDHEKIITAIENRDGAQAQMMMLSHLQSVRAGIFSEES